MCVCVCWLCVLAVCVLAVRRARVCVRVCTDLFVMRMRVGACVTGAGDGSALATSGPLFDPLVNQDDLLTTLEVALHAADISNVTTCCREWACSRGVV